MNFKISLRCALCIMGEKEEQNFYQNCMLKNSCRSFLPKKVLKKAIKKGMYEVVRHG